MNDGLIDLRKDSDYITVSNCILSEHNKAFGIGWKQNVTAKVTINNNFFNSTNGRSPSADNLKTCHMYNYYHRNLTYGNHARGHVQLIVETSYLDVAGPNATIKSNWLVFKDCEGQIMLDVKSEDVIDASDYYAYALQDPYDLPNNIPYFAGPDEEIGS